MLFVGDGVQVGICAGKGVEIGQHQPIGEAGTGALQLEASFMENLRGDDKGFRERTSRAAGNHLGMRRQNKQEEEPKILRHSRDLVAWGFRGIKLNRAGYHFRSEQFIPGFLNFARVLR